MALLPAAARWTGFFEKYVLSLLFLKIALDKASGLRGIAAGIAAGPALGPLESAAVVVNLLVFLYSVFFGLGLLLNRRAVRDPERWRDIAVPLIATFLLYAFTGLAPLVPSFATKNPLPLALQRDAAIAGMLVSVVGYALALWSLAWLGRSLSVVVSVRTVVLHGPYRYVRHPMYLSYLVLVVGLLLAAPSLYSVFLLGTYVVLTVYRARLEEEALCAFSDDYRAYAARTGFLFPRIGGAD